MESAAPGKKTDWEKISLIGLLAFGVVILCLLLWNLLGGNSSRTVQQQTYSDLISTKEIATLSVSEFIYNGIAQTLKSNNEIDYNALYRSTVKVSIDANDIDYTVDDEQKIVTFIFPEFKIEDPVIDVRSVSLIPNRSDLYMDDVIKLCRSDALSEAKKSDKLISSARENLRSIIEGWYSPVLEGYSFEYRFGTAEGGEAK
ncbi:MAG: DUF4230 domain-containing protein [Clostridia bacterium]|nr:DUF4230 domain-containing protein [Clostridia bacterium]